MIEPLLYTTAPGSPLRGENTDWLLNQPLPSQRLATMYTHTPEHQEQNVHPRPFLGIDQSPQPKFRHRLLPTTCELEMQNPIETGRTLSSPTIRAHSLVHRSCRHPLESYLLGSSGRTQSVPAPSPFYQPLISVCRSPTLQVGLS